MLPIWGVEKLNGIWVESTQNPFEQRNKNKRFTEELAEAEAPQPPAEMQLIQPGSEGRC